MGLCLQLSRSRNRGLLKAESRFTDVRLNALSDVTGRKERPVTL